MVGGRYVSCQPDLYPGGEPGANAPGKPALATAELSVVLIKTEFNMKQAKETSARFY